MLIEYSFDDLKKFLETNACQNKEILAGFDIFKSAVSVFDPIFSEKGFSDTINILKNLNNIISLGRNIYNFVLKQKNTYFLIRLEQIKAAYALICYTAYFDVLHDILPTSILKDVKQNENSYMEAVSLNSITCIIYYVDSFTSFANISDHLLSLYEMTTKRIIQILKSYLNEKTEVDVEEVLQSLPEKAVEQYKAQYFELTVRFNDFFKYAQLNNFIGVNEEIKQNRKLIDEMLANTEKIDVGLANLKESLSMQSNNYNKAQTQDIVKELRVTYTGVTDQPLVTEEDLGLSDEKGNVEFPTKIKAFIPQLCKCIIYNQKNMNPESNLLWEECKTIRTIDSYFLEYFNSLTSVDYPLIILGDPGSGKSLLTQVLTTQLMESNFIAIRIPMQNINVEAEIGTIIETHIKQVTGRDIVGGYGTFAAQLNGNPITIFWDGFDELLQAQGKVLNEYLCKLHNFQTAQKNLGRPVRIIVTSRKTFLSKIKIPMKSVIINLMGFDSYQKTAWIKEWNEINSNYFNTYQIKPFALPIENKLDNICDLAKQPLLLLMLALYDSENNDLVNQKAMNRNELYNNLIRRFIKRECSRIIKDFSYRDEIEKQKIIEKEMNILGIIAIGMFNRKENSITTKQLEQDLKLYDIHRDYGKSINNILEESEAIFSKFYFIHSIKTEVNIIEKGEKKTCVYQFLHNTFCEFLIADFILKSLIEVIALVDESENMIWCEAKTELNDYNHAWVNCIIDVPLYTQPVILEMMVEHLPLAVYNYNLQSSHNNLSEDVFKKKLMLFVKHQLKMVLTTSNIPVSMLDNKRYNKSNSLLDYIAVFSLNLVILASNLCEKGFEFIETDYIEKESKVMMPWNKLIGIWKASIHYNDLIGLSAVLRTKRENSVVLLTGMNDKNSNDSLFQPVESLLKISNTLSDSLMIGLLGVHTDKFEEIIESDYGMICKEMIDIDINIYFSYIFNKLRNKVYTITPKQSKLMEARDNYDQINEMLLCIVSSKSIDHAQNGIVVTLLNIIETCVYKNLLYTVTRKSILMYICKLMKTHDSYMFNNAYHLMNLLTKNNLQLFVIVRNNAAYWNDIGYCLRIIQNSYKFKDWLTNYTYRNEYNSYELALLNSFEMLHKADKASKKHAILSKFDVKDLKILVKANPTLLSDKILLMIKENIVNKVDLIYIINLYLTEYENEQQNVETVFIGLQVMINTVDIALFVGNGVMVDKIFTLINEQLLHHDTSFWYLSFLEPKFMINLIDRFSDRLRDKFTTPINWDIYEFACKNYKLSNVILYVRLYLVIAKNKICRGDCLDSFSKVINNFIKYQGFDKSRLDSEEIEVLQGYYQIIDNADKQ